MKVLLDTCVLSELQRAGGSDVVRNAISEFSDEELFLSVVSIGEIAKGIALLDDGIRKRNLRSWLHGLERDYKSRILDIDSATTHIWGELTASAQKKGRQVAASDGLIAATAICHGLHVMTRNIADFEPTNVLLLNPWES